MTASFVLALALIILVGVVLVWLFPEGTENFITWVLLARRVLFGTAVVVFGLFLLYTGALTLMLVGGALMLLVVLYVLHDPDDQFGTALPWE